MPTPIETTSQGRDDDQPSRSPATPLRALGSPDPAGYALLRDVGSNYRDGAEADVLRLVQTAGDRRSDSDEIVWYAKNWAQRYHLDPARANVVRALDLPPDARVLEIGAGCGAVTRYLGEACALVDALEPVPARAAAAAARSTDLDNVAVFVGEIADVPAQPSYDVIIVIGVLEYVGAGSDALEPYREFLKEAAQRLVDGGTLVLAIENQLGVKYLVGAREDHTGRVFDSIESYPSGGHARTFNRRTLEGLLRDTGLIPQTLGAFPDYKMTRAVLGEFPDDASSLAYRIPRFPSPDWTGKRRPRLADERSVWRSLAEAGLAGEFANSFLVLAGKQSSSTLWPAERSAVFYSQNRRAELTTETVVEQQSGRLVFRRHPLAPERSDDSTVRIRANTAPFRPGSDLSQVIARTGLEGAEPYLRQWLELVDSAIRDGDPGVLDLVPHNLILGEDGVLYPIDEEFVVPDVSRMHVVRRGIYLLAKEVASMSPAARWAPATTVGEIMLALGELVGLPKDGSWLQTHIEDESHLQADIRRGPAMGSADAHWVETVEKGMRATIAKPLADLPLGDRLPKRYGRLVKENKRLRTDRAAASAGPERMEAGQTGAGTDAAATEAGVLQRANGTLLERVRALDIGRIAQRIGRRDRAARRG